jgi:predicted amidohydrolase
MKSFLSCIAAVLVFLDHLLAGELNKTNQTATGRPVRVAAFCFRPGKSLDQVLQRLDEEGARGVDLLVLPETWRGQTDRSLEADDGPTIRALAGLAKKHHAYIVSPIDLEREGRRFNTAVMIDREGKVVGAYDKVFPYWSEFDHARPVEPGRSSRVFTTDFGRVGMSICFDVNFPEVWQHLADADAELVLWSSAYSAGAQLGAYALLHHFYIVTATYTGDCQVFDITGERILDERGDGIHVSRIRLDLDRGIYHQNFNIEKRDRLLKEHAGEVRQEKWLDREQWFVLSATQPGVSARGLARQYGLEELRDYIQRSRRAIDTKRGFDFGATQRPAEPAK